MKKSVEYVQAVEKAIKEKYGDAAVQDPRSSWTEEQEREFQEQIKEFHKESRRSEREKRDAGGFLVSRKLVNDKGNRTCPICETYSFKVVDDVYMKKFECCYDCYIQHVEGREDRWEEKKRKLRNDNN